MSYQPQSIYGGYSPIYVTPQPSQTSPVYVMPAPDNSQQITDALARVTQLQRLPQAVPDVFNGEESDKTKFFLWETAFNALIDSAPVTPQQKLYLLFQYLGGRAKKVVEQLQFMSSDPERAYAEARKKLKERFGHSAILSKEFEDKLTNWPKIGNNDAKSMQEFSDFLQQVELATVHIPNLKIFEYSSKLQSLVEKLPSWFQSKWSTKVQKLQRTEGQNAFPSFSDFVNEVNFHAERMNIPQISQTPPVTGNRRNVPVPPVTPFRRGPQIPKKRDQSLPVTALTTSSTPDGPKSSEGTKPVNDITPVTSSRSQTTSAAPKPAFCPFHRTKSHNLDECQKFRELDFAARKDFMFRHRLCFNCVKSSDHTSKTCNQGPPKCEICGNRHLTLLHDPSRPENQTTPISSACTQVCNGAPARSCARIVLLKVSDRSDSSKEVLTYAVLDDQSTDVFVTDSLLNELNVNSQEVNLQVNTILGTNTARMRKVSGLQIQDVNGEHSPVKVPYAYAQENIPATHHDIATPETARQWEHLKVIADQIHHQPHVSIGMLIGRNVPTAFQPLEVIYGEADEPWAERYKFGWTIIGPVCLDKNAFEEPTHKASVNRVTVMREELPIHNLQVDMAANFINKTQVKDMTFPQQIREMMQLDYSELNYSRSNPGTGLAQSIEDRRFCQIISSEIHRNHLGNWEVPLPFRRDKINLPDNREQCVKRLLSLRRKLIKDQKTKENYVEFMQKILDRQHASRVPTDELTGLPGKVWYLPHFDVYHPKKPDQVRVVFDCSAVFCNESLNRNLLQGPDQLNSLVGVLNRFRKDEVAITCDVEQMFHSFYVDPASRDFLRFLWYENNDLNGPIVEFRMNVHLFGAVSSPAVANYCLHETAEVGRAQFGDKAADFLCRDFYVDDGLTSVSTVVEAIKLIEDSQALCASAKLRLHKFASNCKDVLEALPKDDRAKDLKDLDLRHDALPIQRSLGTFWCIESDTLGFRIELKDKPLSRRGILSTISSVYDPLGIVSPVILTGKLILRDLCLQNVDWDDPVPDEILPRWERWRNELPLLENVAVQRCFKPCGFGKVMQSEIHSFSDASQSGIGQVSYLRLVNENKDVHVSFLMSKARVAPIKPVSTPRMELTAAVVSVNVTTMLQNELDYTSLQSVYYTDAEVVIAYIQNDARRFHVFVGNRVQHIRDRSKPEQWHHVPGKENPADEASRSLTASQLLDNKRWFHGPEFLWKSNVPLLNTVPPTELPKDDVEVKSKVLTTVCSPSEEPAKLLVYLQRTSSWYKAKVSVAWIIRAMSNRQTALLARKTHCSNEVQPAKAADISRSDKGTKILPLKVEELVHSERAILRELQQEHFGPVIQSLKNLDGNSDKFQERNTARHRNKRLKKTSNLYKLDPFVDGDGLLRIGGRIRRADMPLDVKHPLILPKSDHITDLIVRHFHSATVHHQGRGITHNAIRQAGFWIVNGRSSVARTIAECVTCRKLRSRPLTQKMSDLPEERVSPTAPFHYTGMDVFGPFYVKEGRKTLKRYGLVFTCLASRAIHLETLNSMEADSFISALRRFICRRGKVRELRSDQGTNFIGAKNELAAALQTLDQARIKNFLRTKDCDWIDFNMNVPTASHMGGIWERMIKSVRSVLLGLLQEQGTQLDDEALRTLMTEAENVINSRPLTVDSLSDAASPEPITPNHLLTLKSEVVLPPPGSFDQLDVYSRKRWRRVQHLANQFWFRWRREYLSLLQKRQKWNVSQRDCREGDVVLLLDGDLPRNQWPLAQVMKVFPSKDGLIRKVQLSVVQDGKRKQLERPIHKLVLLLPREEATDQDVIPVRGASTKDNN